MVETKLVADFPTSSKAWLLGITVFCLMVYLQACLVQLLHVPQTSLWPPFFELSLIDTSAACAIKLNVEPNSTFRLNNPICQEGTL
jgi:hypothetical protein